jgi:ADP-L-glycero-D-manno-heptose 6-epimerase
MIVITGAAGFIASKLVEKLNQERFFDLVLVDDFSRADKERNWKNTKHSGLVHRDDFPQWLIENQKLVEFVFHLGARTDTTEQSVELFNRLNLEYSKQIWNICVEYGLPLVYASSAATYGNGEHGYSDDHLLIPRLNPLNPYGQSKQDFDVWALEQHEKPYFWVGLKFFNVYGPGEYHKGRMASVVFHAYNQIQQTGGMKLFRSHREGIADGEQMRDFIFVKDVAEVLYWLMHNRKRENCGIYNLGTGQARSFLDLTKAVFKGMGVVPNISFVDTPEDIRDTYQYYTQADMKKLVGRGYNKPFTSLEDGVEEYVRVLMK